LNGVRKGYYHAIATVTGADQHTKNEDTMVDPKHIRHCIDYLRQSLMCHADTNFEPVIEALGGATGFGTVHHCQSYQKVLDFYVDQL
jgi:hypothetical protein